MTPHWVPSTAETDAAAIAVSRAAPGLRMMRPPSTPEISHMP